MVPSLLACSLRYWLQLAPQARTELARWRARAQTLPDPPLRATALGKLHRESLSAEAAAFIALLAVDRHHAVRRIVAFELLYELLDALTEDQPLHYCLNLHQRLRATIETEVPPCDSYTRALIDAARTPCTQALAAAINTVCEAQSHNHAPDGQLQAWAGRQDTGLLWWETTAAGISSIKVHALIASPVEHHPALEGAYLQIDALASLLDALRDAADDHTTGNHNFASHYSTANETAARLAALVSDGLTAVRRLPNHRVHHMILAGLVAYNLSDAPSDMGLTAIDPLIRIGLVAMRIRRSNYGPGALPRGIFFRPNLRHHHRQWMRRRATKGHLKNEANTNYPSKL